MKWCGSMIFACFRPTQRIFVSATRTNDEWPQVGSSACGLCLSFLRIEFSQTVLVYVVIIFNLLSRYGRRCEDSLCELLKTLRMTGSRDVTATLPRLVEAVRRKTLSSGQVGVVTE